MIVVSAGAGGHGGTLNPMSLISEVRSFLKNNTSIGMHKYW